jgi:predicted permease
VAVGVLAGRLQLVAASSIKDLSKLAFLVLGPALLFRTMSNVRLQDMQPAILLAYYLAAACIFLAAFAIGGFNRRSAVVALTANFGNNVMIGIPLVGLAFGEAGLVHLLAVIATQSVVMLTVATVLLELAVVREQRAAGGTAQRPVGQAVLGALRSAVIHPVPLPIIAGLLFNVAGLALPPVIDKPVQLLGQAFAPLALLMVGASLAQTRVRGLWWPALQVAAAKNVLQPLLVLAFAWLLGITGLPLAVLVIAACMPTGANAFLFAQRYEVAQDLVTATMLVSALLSLVSLTLALSLFGG